MQLSFKFVGPNTAHRAHPIGFKSIWDGISSSISPCTPGGTSVSLLKESLLKPSSEYSLAYQSLRWAIETCKDVTGFKGRFGELTLSMSLPLVHWGNNDLLLLVFVSSFVEAMQSLACGNQANNQLKSNIH